MKNGLFIKISSKKYSEKMKLATINYCKIDCMLMQYVSWIMLLKIQGKFDKPGDDFRH